MSNPERKIHPANAYNRDFIAMAVPLLLMAVFFFGPRVLVLALLGVVTAKLADRLAAFLRGRAYDKTENSSVVIALVIVLMMPVTVRLRVVIAAVLVAVLVGKEAFGGFGGYPFNPAALGFCAAAVSWPDQIQRYPAPLNWLGQRGLTFEQLWAQWEYSGAALVEGPSATLRAGGLPKIDFWNLLLGNYAGPLGIGCSLVILACAGYLAVKGRISIPATAAFLGMVAFISFVFPRYTELSFATFPQDVEQRLQVVKFEALSGAIVFAAVFMVSESVTLPKNGLSQLVYGLALGLATMMFRYFGTYELGTCFAFLLVNALSGYLDRLIGEWMERRRRRKAPEKAGPGEGEVMA